MTNTAQKFIDNLVVSHPNASGGEILQMIAPERRDAARNLLRWPPGVAATNNGAAPPADRPR